MLATGLALTIGLNSVDPAHYRGWTGDLGGCEADVDDYAQIAAAQGFRVTTLKTREATRGRVSQEILGSARQLRSGDIFMLTYSGHGGWLPDLNRDEEDWRDETWCLYDGQMVDDELSFLFSRFEKGVRILVLSDSCHSGTVTRGTRMADPSLSLNVDANSKRYRYMPEAIVNQVYYSHRDFYDKILGNEEELKEAEKKVRASVLLISACTDMQKAQDMIFNGLFTFQLKKIWDGGAFQGTYKEFHRAILNAMPAAQQPNYYLIGKRNSSFEKQRPFTV